MSPWFLAWCRISSIHSMFSKHIVFCSPLLTMNRTPKTKKPTINSKDQTSRSFPCTSCSVLNPSGQALTTSSLKEECPTWDCGVVVFLGPFWWMLKTLDMPMEESSRDSTSIPKCTGMDRLQATIHPKHPGHYTSPPGRNGREVRGTSIRNLKRGQTHMLQGKTTNATATKLPSDF